MNDDQPEPDPPRSEASTGPMACRDVDPDRASGARVYDYMLGGKDHYAVDRAAAEAMIATLPELPLMARANRAFLHRAVHHLVADLGVTQFLDVGSGLPTMCNVHQVAQDVDPTARVVYVDHDPVVAAHYRALLTSTPQGRTAFIEADATEPASITADPALTQTLDPTRPIGLMLVSFLMYFDDTTVGDIVPTLLDALPPGSYVTISHPTADFTDAYAVEQAQKAGQAAGLTYHARTHAQVAKMFAGLRLCDPGVVPMLDWRPAPAGLACGLDPYSIHYYVGMAHKPA